MGGAGFWCGDRCVKWVLSHSSTRGYVTLPEEILSKLHRSGTEREIAWDMTEMTKQLSECVEVEIPTYVMEERGDLVNLMPINASDSDEEDSSLTWEDEWEYIPSVAEVLSHS